VCVKGIRYNHRVLRLRSVSNKSNLRHELTAVVAAAAAATAWRVEKKATVAQIERPGDP